MKKYLIHALAALLGLGLAAQALAAPPLSNRPPLTPDQIAKIKANRQARQQTLTPQQQQMKQLSDQLRAELQKKPVDRDRVSDLLKQLDALRNAARIEQMQSLLDNNKNLSAKQRQRLTDSLQRAKARQPQQQPAQ